MSGTTVKIIAGSKVVLDKLNEIKNTRIDQAKELKPIASGALPTIPASPADQDYKMYVSGGKSGATFTGVGLPVEGLVLSPRDRVCLWFDKDAREWEVVDEQELPVAEELTQFGDFIFDSIEQPIPYSAQANSLFSGFGQPYGQPKNIGGVRFWYHIRSTNIPTQMRLMFFDTNRSGVVLLDKTISVTPVSGTNGNIAEFIFDDVFENTENKQIWIEIRADGCFGWLGSSPDVVYTEALGYPRRRVNSTVPSSIDIQPPSFGFNEAQIELLKFSKEVVYNDLGKKAFDNSLSRSLSSIYNINTEMYAKVTDNNLKIISKYNNDYDLLMIFEKALFNEIYTFRTVGLVQNASKNLAINKIDDIPYITLNSTGSDQIGPVSIQGFGWLGGGHSYQDKGILKTAKCNWWKIYNGDIEIGNGFEGYVSNLNILVDVSILNPDNFPSEVELINERVLYYVTSGNIEVSVSHKYNSAATVSLYYGAQIYPRSFYTKIWFNNSMSAVQNYTNTVITSGNGNFFPDKAVISDDTKEFCMSLQVNRNVGLGADISQIGSSRSAIITADTTKKIYFNQIFSKSIGANEEYFWNGCYSFFDGRNVDNINIPYVNGLTLNKKKLISLDSISHGNYIIDDINYIGRQNNIFYQVNASIPTYSESRGLKVTFTNKGSVIV